MKSKLSLFLFLLLSAAAFPKGELRVIYSGASRLVVEFTPRYAPIDTTTVSGSPVIKLSFNGATYLTGKSAWGAPKIPYYQFLAGIPAGAVVSCNLLQSESRELRGLPEPIHTPVKVNGVTEFRSAINEQKYGAFTSPAAVRLAETGNIRGLSVAGIEVWPVQFSPKGTMLKVFTRMVLEIVFTGGTLTDNPTDDDLLKDAVVNYPVAKNWVSARPPLAKTTVVNSVLASGKWVRFEAPDEGIYKITRATLANFGIAADVDPRTIKIYNNGGLLVPESNRAPRPADLVENAIYVAGEEDGKFNDTDYILFYARSTDFWYYDSIARTYRRNYSPYSRENFYWITSGGANGKRMAQKQSLTSAGVQVTDTRAYLHVEEDKINIGKSGRVFLGDEFSEYAKSRTYVTKLEGLKSGTPISYAYRFVNASSGSFRLDVSESNTIISQRFIPGFGDNEYSYGNAAEETASFPGTLVDGRSSLKFLFNLSGVSSLGYIDYFEIGYTRELKATSDRLLFFSKDSSAVHQYRLSEFSRSDIVVFDVSRFADVQRVTGAYVSGGEFRFTLEDRAGAVCRYVAASINSALAPVNPVEVKNQNLRGVAQGAKFIIITPAEFKSQADRLKNYRETQDKLPLSTLVVDVNDIFNEFSGGLKDVTAIRDYIRYAFENWQTPPQYVLLFADGDYDFRNIEGVSKNFIYPYETLESLDEISSYASDDFFVNITPNDNYVDLAIGRINNQSLADATVSVDKIIAYETASERSNWRNLVTLVADDGVTSRGNEGATHTVQSEDLSRFKIPGYMDQKKIYMSAYPEELTSLGRRKPAVTEAIIEAVNQGTLLLNYIGHGSPDLWAHEQVFVRSSTVPRFTNKNYFFLTAATCDFGYYDRPGSQSSAEDLLLKPRSGAIGSLVATRPVYSNLNAALNEDFYSALFSSGRDSLNLPLRVGRAYFLAKRFRNQENDLKFHLLGDPTIRLNFPEGTASIDSVNGINVKITSAAIKALATVTVKGTIVNSDSSTNTAFNGEGVLTVFDSERNQQLPEFGPNFYVTMQGGIIFRGRVSISGGKFNTTFVVPKDISYENQNGKLYFYYYGSNSDGFAFSPNVIIGGTDSAAVNDNKGPAMEIYFDDTGYENGTLVRPDGALLVKLSDPVGLNTTGTGVGHKLQAVLNGNENEPIDLTNYFTGDLNSGGKSGIVTYRFNGIAEGNYEVSVKAYDVFNNLTRESAYFSVVSGDNMVVRYLYNYPNPFSSGTTFTFQQNQPQPVNVKIRVFTVAGRLVKEIERFAVNEKFVRIDWDGRDRDGAICANGTYLYKVMVESADGVYKENLLGKLAIIR